MYAFYCMYLQYKKHFFKNFSLLLQPPFLLLFPTPVFFFLPIPLAILLTNSTPFLKYEKDSLWWGGENK